MSPIGAQALFQALAQPLAAARAEGAGINVWAVAGLGRNELRNAAVLAWLLNPRGSHGFGAALLEGLIASIRSDDGNLAIPDTDLTRATVMTEERPLGSDRDRVDISVETERYILFLEVKIDALEGDRQLARYWEAACRKAAATARDMAFVIFLSPRPPADPNHSGLAAVRWSQIAHILDEICAKRPATAFNTLLIRQFADHVRSF